MDLSQCDKFIEPKEVESLATEFGSFYCKDEQFLCLIKTVMYIGNTIGVLAFGILSDNIGRKKALVWSQFFVCIGMVVLSASWNIYVAGVGLFLIGLG